MPSPWNLEALRTAPPMVPGPEPMSASGVRGMYFAGLPWRGRPTATFAWLGVPAAAAGRRVPGMVLVHGGGGSALAEWVRLWNRRGYAAVAMDYNGHVPVGDSNAWAGTYQQRRPHGQGGPDGWGGFDQVDEPIEDQWPYHAVANVCLAHSLLRAQDGVDPERIGITGVSWGGYLTCLTVGVDNRYACAAPIYGCGFLGENSMWLPDFAKMGAPRAAKWLNLWDPKHYLPQARLPMLWVTGTNDPAYPLESHLRSARLPMGPRTMSVRVRMVHAHGGNGEYAPEVHGFANQELQGEPPLVKITSQGRDGVRVFADFASALPLDHAELCFTHAVGRWLDRYWETAPAKIDGTRAWACLPDRATAWYLNIHDCRQMVVSSAFEEVGP
jgi:dienelactone hydrolase